MGHGTGWALTNTQRSYKDVEHLLSRGGERLSIIAVLLATHLGRETGLGHFLLEAPVDRDRFRRLEGTRM